VSGLAGAVVSSTAVTTSFGQTARSGENPWPLAGVAILAATVSLLRVTAIVLLIEPGVVRFIAPATLVAVVILTVSGAALMTMRGAQQEQAINARNPFELIPLAIVAALFAITITVGAALTSRIGNSGLIALSALSGCSMSMLQSSVLCAQAESSCRRRSSVRQCLPLSQPTPPDAICRRGRNACLLDAANGGIHTGHRRRNRRLPAALPTMGGKANLVHWPADKGIGLVLFKHALSYR